MGHGGGIFLFLAGAWIVGLVLLAMQRRYRHFAVHFGVLASLPLAYVWSWNAMPSGVDQGNLRVHLGAPLIFLGLVWLTWGIWVYEHATGGRPFRRPSAGTVAKSVSMTVVALVLWLWGWKRLPKEDWLTPLLFIVPSFLLVMAVVLLIFSKSTRA